MAADLASLTTRQLRRKQKRAREKAWRRGDLRWLLRPCQREVYDAIKEAWASGHLSFLLEISRRFGKSIIDLVLCLEVGLTVDNATIQYAAPDAKLVENLLLPNMRVLLAKDCPEDIAPVWSSRGYWAFPSTGARLHMAGCDDRRKADALRGPKSDLFVLDEAGFIDILGYVYRDIAMPQTLPNPDTLPKGGKILLSSSPAVSPGHDFTGMCIAAEAKGNYARRTIYDSTAATPEIIEQYMDEAGGEQSTAWQREYLCRRVVDTTRAIIAEFTQHRESIVQEMVRPEYYDTYVAFDIGWTRDFTFVLFAYWDFPNAKLVVEDELVIEPGHMGSDVLADGIRRKEQELWATDRARWEAEHDTIEIALGYAPANPLHSRWGDNDEAVLHELSRTHKLAVNATEKHDKESAINAVKLLIRQDKFRVHPRCKQLIGHMTAGIWNKSHTSFERTEGFGHFDGVDAAIYLVRNVKRGHNPFPELPPVKRSTHHVRAVSRDRQRSQYAGLIKAHRG